MRRPGTTAPTADAAARRPALAWPRPSAWERLTHSEVALAYAFVLPTVLILGSVVVYPFLSALWISLQSKVAGLPGRFVGLANYAELARDPNFARIFCNTLFYTFFAVVLKFLIGLVTALVLAEKRPFNALYRTILFVPWAIPTVLASLNWLWVYDEFNGLLNVVLVRLGLLTEPVAWLAEPRLAMWAVIAVVVWNGTPFYTMHFLAGLQAIPKELYEAAEVDGATILQRFRHITIPSMKNVFMVTVMLSSVFTSTSLVAVHILTNGAPAFRTDIVPNFSYNFAIVSGRLGIGSAVNIVFFPVLVSVVVLLSRRLLRRSP
ncbi:MAG TPA: sugar ABC transporter permease [Methylomirabilota bacterium]|nr:sugar ABC transporter permease [Methylomirabilota bacterium]